MKVEYDDKRNDAKDVINAGESVKNKSKTTKNDAFILMLIVAIIGSGLYFVFTKYFIQGNKVEIKQPIVKAEAISKEDEVKNLDIIESERLKKAKEKLYEKNAAEKVETTSKTPITNKKIEEDIPDSNSSLTEMRERAIAENERQAKLDAEKEKKASEDALSAEKEKKAREEALSAEKEKKASEEALNEEQPEPATEEAFDEEQDKIVEYEAVCINKFNYTRTYRLLDGEMVKINKPVFDELSVGVKKFIKYEGNNYFHYEDNLYFKKKEFKCQ